MPGRPKDSNLPKRRVPQWRRTDPASARKLNTLAAQVQENTGNVRPASQVRAVGLPLVQVTPALVSNEDAAAGNLVTADLYAHGIDKGITSAGVALKINNMLDSEVLPDGSLVMAVLLDGRWEGPTTVWQ